MDEVADEFGVSRDTIKRARSVAENGAPELIIVVKAANLQLKKKPDTLHYGRRAGDSTTLCRSPLL